MKKNIAMRVASLILMCTIITSCFVSSTFAKYTSSVDTQNSTATVAKWAFEVQGTDITTASPTVSFNLFDTANRKDSNGTDEETDVSANKIAPGTTGSFSMTVENKSEVTATYAISFTKSGATGIPLQFKVGGGEWSDSLAGVSATKIPAGSGVQTVTVQWKWPFEKTGDVSNGDTTDTSLGVAAGQVIVNATISATQVD